MKTARLNRLAFQSAKDGFLPKRFRQSSSSRAPHCQSLSLLSSPSILLSLSPVVPRVNRSNIITIKTRNQPIQRRRRYSTLADDGSTTIFALATAPGTSAIAIVRISGPDCLAVYRALCPGRRDPVARQATLRRIHEPSSGLDDGEARVLDSAALVLYFPAPHTATGEDVLELHLHGGQAVVRAVLDAIPKCLGSQKSHGATETTTEPPTTPPGTPDGFARKRIRYAEPGEFTRRAFYNNRLDLTQVEALGDLLSAATEQQRRLSVRGATSKLAKQYESWRRLLLDARGELEALIDFSEDQHFDETPAELCRSVARQVKTLSTILRAHCTNAVRGEMLRNGIVVSLLGAPNVGKSSLLNAIVGRDAAIVSAEAGTTRDVVEVGLDIGGFLCRVGDTAGLRTGTGVGKDERPGDSDVGLVEKEGMRRARERATDSDVVIVVLSFERYADGEVSLHLVPEVVQTAAELVQKDQKPTLLVVINKSDLCPDEDARARAKRKVIQTIPGIQSSQISLISCQNAQISSGDEQVSSGEQLRQDATALRHQAEDPEIADQIQTFLNTLIAQFRDLTAAVVGVHASVDSEAGEADDAVQGEPAPAPAPAPGLAPDPSTWQESLGATQRHRLLLERCVEHLDAFLALVVDRRAPGLGHGIGFGIAPDAPALGYTGLNAGSDLSGPGCFEPDIVLAAEQLRGAATALARITGRGEAGDVEDVLGVVFEKFCVGK